MSAWEKENILVFGSLLEDCDPSDDDTFTEIMHYALERYGFKAKQIAEKFEINSSTVGRWALGANKPHPLVRPLIVDWLKEQIKEREKAITVNAHSYKDLNSLLVKSKSKLALKS